MTHTPLSFFAPFCKAAHVVSEQVDCRQFRTNTDECQISSQVVPVLPESDPRAEKEKEAKMNAALATGVKRLFAYSTRCLSALERHEVIRAEVHRLRKLRNMGFLSEAFPETPLPPQSKAEANYDDLVRSGVLGVGGFGKVELCEDKKSGRFYALKTLSKTFAYKTSMLPSLKMERLVLATAYSPFVVSFYGSYNRSLTISFLLEPLLGGDLYTIYSRHNLHGNTELAQYYMASVAMGVTHLHSLYIICRGVKPEDCCLDSNGQLKLVDMGFAKFVDSKTYTTCGTPDYLAPEIIKGSGHGPAVDWFALGVMLFELLSGRSPFASSLPMQVYANVMKGIRAVDFPSSIPAEAKSFILDVCAHEASDRLPMRELGFAGLQSHAWNRDLDWIGLEDGSLEPPYHPELDGDDDISQFTHLSSEESVVPGHVASGREVGEGWDSEF